MFGPFVSYTSKTYALYKYRIVQRGGGKKPKSSFLPISIQQARGNSVLKLGKHPYRYFPSPIILISMMRS